VRSIRRIILKILLISIILTVLVINAFNYYKEKRNPPAIKELILPEQGGPPLVETPAWSAEFSAQVAIKDAGKIRRGKIFFQDGKIRQEFLDKWGRTITIVRPDKKIILVVLSQDKAYMQLALKEHYPGPFIQMPPEALEKRRVGTGTVQGYAVDKYEVTVRSGEKGVEKQILWMAKQLGVPIKLVVKGRKFSIEYYNIKMVRVADWLFDPPAGFRQTSQLLSFSEKGRRGNPEKRQTFFPKDAIGSANN
jgi:hypothetical protein